MTVVQGIILAIVAIVLMTTIVSTTYKVPTVSNTLRDWAWKYSSVPFLAGVLIGHWFVPLRWLNAPVLAIWPLLLIPLALIIGLDVWNHYRPLPRWMRWPLIWLLLGMIGGAFLWSQG